MTMIVRRRRPKTPQRAEPPELLWSPAALYGRSVKNRRVMILELVAWAITEAERERPRAEFLEFEQMLQDVRDATWGERPWSGATDPERFAEHWAAIGRVFTADPRAGYPIAYHGRSRQPITM